MSTVADREPPGPIAAGALAVAVHVVFMALLVFGVSWQHRVPEAVMVDLWTNLPPAPAVKAPEPKPAPKVEVAPPVSAPPIIKPQPKPEPSAVVKPQPKPEPPPAPVQKPVQKPDIALEKERQEKAAREREERARAEARKREQVALEQARKKEEAAEAKRRELEEKQRAALEAARAAQEAEQARAAREQIAAIERVQQQAAAARASAIAEYKAKIQAKIYQYVTLPPDLKGNPQVEFEVVLLPSGDVLNVRMRRSSQHAAYDAAVERAILRAQPLPVPPDPSLFRDFRELNLQFRPNP